MKPDEKLASIANALQSKTVTRRRSKFEQALDVLYSALVGSDSGAERSP